ncbi:Wzt carbohydrate-binding domain-containing protein [Escherichia coli]|uniref:Wzt carbohydrate-binding domain-containing protein n=1 Tax=Escherichia coli TaxID=562 RepID=UPI002810E667|nr:Wzt carbohydrate-binding domain-containing protein [Escherichia coli]
MRTGLRSGVSELQLPCFTAVRAEIALMSGGAFAVTHHAFSSGAGRTSDGNGSHASTLKSPSYTKSVSWQHYPHDQESVRTLTNRAILLDRGTQLSTGLSSEVLLEYRRLLHREESKYFSQLAKEVAAHADATRDINQTPTAPAKIEISANAETPAVEETSPSRTDKLSFGEGEAEVENVELFTASGERSNAFNPGDKIRVRVNCKVNKDINHINVGIRIRNKEGVKIYSWGTLNQDMYVRFHQLKDPQFWEREFKAGERFYVDMEFECTLGTNLYEIQAAISYEGTPNYFSQRILHWRDEAAFFHVNVLRDEYFFGGILDLKMTAEW